MFWPLGHLKAYQITKILWGTPITTVISKSYLNTPKCGTLGYFTTDRHQTNVHYLNRLTPNDPYMGRTAPLTSKRCILYIYSTNIDTECFKHALYSPFFFSSKWSLFHNANLFGFCIIHILYTGCAEIEKIIPAPKG
jgi:hypothetical protein